MNPSDGPTTTVNESGIPSIPGPYLSPEQTESFPLKQALYGGAQKTARGCCSCMQSDDGGGSLRIIITCFFTLTLAITIALAAQIYFGDYQLVPHGSVATDDHVCSVMGTTILKKGGNAVDAAVASTLCMGVVNFHVTGLGGGGFLLVYDHRKRKMLDVIDFREEAPANFFEARLASSEAAQKSPEQDTSISNAGLFVGVPGLLRGLGMAHKLYGKLEWKELVMPSVELARIGIYIPNSLFSARSRLLPFWGVNTNLLKNVTSLAPGQKLPLPHLAAALERIATLGPNELYNGSLAKTIIDAVSQAGGNMTYHDLSSYQPKRRQVMQARFANFDVYVPGPPSGGPFLLSTLERLHDANLTLDYVQDVNILYNKMEDTYQMSKGLWGDPSFNESQSEDGENGTAWNFPEAVASHVAAVDMNDLYVSVVSGLNTWFGSQIMSDAGFILNNALRNFGVGNNSVAGGKRPLSLATPVIATQTNEVCGRRLVLGAGDATVMVQLLVELLLLHKNVTSSVEAPRFHLTPTGKQLGYEVGRASTFSNETLTGLQNLGFILRKLPEPYQSCNLVEKVQDTLTSHSDSRGGGLSSRFQ